MCKIALITAIFGDYDTLKVVPDQTINIDKFCFTNSKILPEEEFNGWKLIYPDYPRPDLHNRMKAKYFRMLSHTIKELKQYEIIVWVDASLQVIDPDFIRHITIFLDDYKIKFYNHHVRDCIYEEAIISSTYFKKYAAEPIEQQIKSYKEEGYPQKNGLIETGCFARIINNDTNKLMEDWWLENIKYSYQDQISLPYVLWKNNFKPFIINENIHNNNLFFRVERTPENDIV